MVYVDCTSNLYISTLPTLPNGLVALYCGNNAISTIPTSFPNTLVTMSFSNNNISSWYTAFPTALTYFDCSHNSITDMPVLPAGMLHVDVSFCHMTPTAIDDICTTLLANGLNNGALTVYFNSGYLAGTAAKFTTLTSRGWTVLY